MRHRRCNLGNDRSNNSSRVILFSLDEDDDDVSSSFSFRRSHLVRRFCSLSRDNLEVKV